MSENMFITRRAFDVLIEQASIPNPRQLWGALWHEGEVACLFADTNVGKSIYAVQIAEHIAYTEKVVYFDFEMSDKQFQMRYSLDGAPYAFPDNFLRATYSLDYDGGLNLTDVIEHIALAAIDAEARVIIIDNITWICNRCESGDAAGEFMQMLIDIKRRYDLSILVLAHTPKRNIHSPLTQNSLAGSKRLANFMDSIFAIGVDSTTAPCGRYVKQIKMRSCEQVYGDSSVLLGRLEKREALLRIWHDDPCRTAPEASLLGLPEDSNCDKDRLIADILRLKAEGMTQTSIAAELGVSQGQVCKLIKSVTSPRDEQ